MDSYTLYDTFNSSIRLIDNIYIHHIRGGTIISTYSFHNTAGSVFIYGALFSLIYQQPFPKVNAIAVGSRNSSNIFVSASFAGTTSYGTIGALMQSYTWGSNYAIFGGTISITSDLTVTDMQIGSAYLRTGDTKLFNYVYAYKSGLNAQYYSGDVLKIRWLLGFSL